ncbi:hypothetical protein [Marinilabilia salmonicolor]|uniref:hypothetical protein n=1 Tax=Marinilabilia salmonicolor TaxID=989 RepID=UPI001F322D2D|nr:hypothetical protein [Marinilabilia salmonicolor]
MGEDEESADDCPYAAKKTSVFQFPHLLLGVLALFFYVGVETVALEHWLITLRVLGCLTLNGMHGLLR